MQVGCHAVRFPDWIPTPKGLVAVIDENRATTGAVTRFDVVENVPGKPAFFECDPMIASPNFSLALT
jgi:hypothetical protein